MTFEQWSPFPIIIFFACCSDIIVVIGCIFTKTKTNIKNEDVPSIPRLVSLAQADQLIFFLSFLSLQRSLTGSFYSFLSPLALGRCVLSLFVSLHFCFVLLTRVYCPWGLRWSVSVLGPVSYPVDRGIVASRGIRHWAGPGSTFTWPFYCLPGLGRCVLSFFAFFLY